MLKGMVREAKVEEELFRILKNILEKKNYKIEGILFQDLEPQYPVDSGTADLVLFTDRPRKPILVIECKRKDLKTKREIRSIDPLSPRVIDQALFYATKIGAPLFSTTNGRVFTLFIKPEREEPFSIERHRLLIKEIELKEESIEEILSLVAKWKAGVPITRTAIDWTFIIRLRSFVKWLSEQLLPLIEKEAKRKGEFSAKLKEYEEKIGKISLEAFARETAYLLMNKIVFYKILERHYPLEELKGIIAPNSESYMNALKEYFSRAIEVTNDFEPIFSAGVYDYVPLPNEEWVLEEINAFIEDMGKYKLEEIESDVVGFIYENLIPPAERHSLGQFYTPPPIAELIVKWAVRDPEDKVLDPAVGSGTFLIKAYQRLKELKKEPSHEEILKQIYALDINPFPAHLTAINLAMRDVRHPTSEMNILVRDFFQLMYGQKYFVAYSVKTPRGERERKISIPLFDAIVANPPYTRWTEIPEKTRMLICETVGETLKKYNLTARVRQGVEPGIYMHFIMWGLNFLKEGGRLGMIISDSWLQTDYGVDFGKFLLNNFKVKALIDISSRVFPVPLIGTCIILLEKCSRKEEREENDAVFMYLDVEKEGSLQVEEILDAIENPENYEDKYIVKVVKQSEISREQKWINIIFDTEGILEKLRKKTVPMKEYFEPSRGNSLWSIWSMKHGKRPDVGAKDFFYLNEGKVEQWDLEDYAYPALTSSRYAVNFTFTKKDWEELKERGVDCYLFICHKKKNELPKNVREYVNWGETECRTQIRGTRGGGKICSEALACQEREKLARQPKGERLFYGWYDLGGVEKAPIMAVYQSRYKTRFILCQYPVATYHAIITCIPKMKFSELQLKALLAYLNSSFVQLYIESTGRTTGAVGPIGLEVKHAQEIPVIDVNSLNKNDLESLSNLFEKLERKARELGGADKRENVEKLWNSVIAEIDEEVARILQLPKKLARDSKILAKTMMERRLSRAEEAAPEAIGGEEVARIRVPMKSRKTVESEDLSSLKEWL
ncbi:MAG: N-6 DNA methylase [Candidatus Bathyarchaeia archaeon]